MVVDRYSTLSRWYSLIYPDVLESFDRVRVARRAPGCPGCRVAPLKQQQLLPDSYTL